MTEHVQDDLDIEQIIAAARPALVEVPVCLAGDLTAEHDRLSRELTEAEARGRGIDDDSLTGSPVRAAAEAVRDIEDRMRAASVTFTLQALPNVEYAMLKAKHTDGTGKVDVDGFLLALTVASIVKPNADPARLLVLLRKVSQGQLDAITAAAWRVNTGAVDVPFSRHASAILGTGPSSTS